jgi:protein gp37
VSWKKPRRIFVNSMSDLFHQGVPSEFIEAVWQAMAQAPWHTFQILTKRPERMAVETRSGRLEKLRHVSLGTSVESADVLNRLDDLRRVEAKVRFVSFEPLLGSVVGADLSGIDWAIVGGESGPRARPMHAEWVDEIEEICRAAKTLFFFKQWGGRRKDRTGRVRNERTYDAMPPYSALTAHA